jgi:hypothetical protein
VQVGFNDLNLVSGGAICFDRVLNNVAPEAACQDVTVAADDSCTADASIDAGSSDPDGDALTYSQDPAGPYPLGTTEVTLTVTDPGGLSDSCTANVTVVDLTPPVVTCSLDALPDDESSDDESSGSNDDDSNGSGDDDEGDHGDDEGDLVPPGVSAQGQRHGNGLLNIGLVTGGDDFLVTTQPNTQSNYSASDSCNDVTVSAFLVPGPDAVDDSSDDESDGSDDGDHNDNHTLDGGSEDEDSDSEHEDVCETFAVADDQLFKFRCSNECKTKVKHNGLIDIRSNGLTLSVQATDAAGNTATCEAVIDCTSDEHPQPVMSPLQPETPPAQGTVDINRRR